MKFICRKEIYLCIPNQEKMTEEKLISACMDVIRTLYRPASGLDVISLEKTREGIDGDYTLVVFPLVKYSGKSPEATASEIGSFLKERIPEISSFNVIKGFLNITLSNGFWIDFLIRENLNMTFGTHPEREEKPVVLEFSSPNTNKPLHLGHIRNNLLGLSLSRILEANGFRVIRVNLVNDRGIHICKSMFAYILWGDRETPESTGVKGDHFVGKYYVLFETRNREQIAKLTGMGLTEDEALKSADMIREAQEILRRWEAGDPEIRELWEKMNGWTYAGFDETYRNLGISFDKTEYESDTYLEGKKIVMNGVKRRILRRKPDGSIWIDLRKEGADEKLLLRSDGTSVYMTQDLGTAVLRFNEFQPSRMIYVVGNEQIYHFDVLRKVLSRLGEPAAKAIFHLSYGMVDLPSGKMKSREGTVVDADDLMKEMYRTAEETTRGLGKANEFPEDEAKELFRIIGLGALKYFILKVDPKKNMLFDPKESIDFNGNTGPFIQYTYARIQSLIKKAGTDAQYPPLATRLSLPDMYSLVAHERSVIRLLYRFPAIVGQAGDELSPALVANYIYELAKAYNTFYQEIPVLKAESGELIRFRLTLSEFTGKVIRTGLDLLGIEAPDRM
jgi:arginyl-tRNA synthetase